MLSLDSLASRFFVLRYPFPSNSRSLNIAEINRANFSSFPSFLRGIPFCFPFDDNARNRYAATSGTGDATKRSGRAKRSNCFFPLLCILRCASISPFPRKRYVTLKPAFTTHRSNDLRFQRNLSLSSQQWRRLDNVKNDRCYLRLFLTKQGARKPRSNNTY